MTLLDVDPYSLPCGFENGPEPPFLGGKAMVMTDDRKYVGNMRYIDGTNQSENAT